MGRILQIRKKGWKQEDPEGGGRQTWRQLSKKVVYNGLREVGVEYKYKSCGKDNPVKKLIRKEKRDEEDSRARMIQDHRVQNCLDP